MYAACRSPSKENVGRGTWDVGRAGLMQALSESDTEPLIFYKPFSTTNDTERSSFWSIQQVHIQLIKTRNVFLGAISFQHTSDLLTTSRQGQQW